MTHQEPNVHRFLPTLQPASPDARALADLMGAVTIVAVAIFFLVVALVVIALVRYRGVPGEEDPPAHPASNKVEIAWTITPLLLLTIIFSFSLHAAGFMNPPPAPEGAPDIVIRGHQWWWEAYYPASGVVVANEIHIPTGRTLHARIEGADVIHSFWVPALARKLDMIPGKVNHLWIEADTAGIYHGSCAEFCGAQHAHMRFLVIATTDSAFAAWQAAQLRPAAQPANDLARNGLALIHQKACLQCHRLNGVGGDIAPDLTHLSSRRTLAAATLPNTPENLVRWLHDPGAIKPGTKMPNFQLSDSEIAALVAYLEGRP